MKRSFAISLMFVVAMGVAACGSPAERQAQTATATDGWIAGPQVERVSREGGTLRVMGQAASFGRVVLTGPDGVAYAAGADETGHFDIRLPAPKADVLLTVEAQVGQSAYPAPWRLLVSADPGGPVALLGIGAPTRRLGSGAGLDAIDTDGRAGFLSGRAASNADVAVVRDGVGLTARTDAEGRWSLAVGDNASTAIQVGGRIFIAPAATPSTDGTLIRSGQGWQIAWVGPAGGRQISWFPDVAP